MTLVAELLESLSLIFAADSARAVTGRITDQISVPLAGAVVRILSTGVFSGSELGRAVTNDNGEFSIAGINATEYVIAVETGGVERRIFENRLAPLALGDVRVVLPLRLTASVGDQADNRPYDVARIGDRLHRIGRLTAADAPDPALRAALAEHITACFGRPLPVMRIDRIGPVVMACADNPPFPITHIALATPVGDLPGRDPAIAVNAGASIAVVQERLHQLGLLNAADRRAELADITAVNVDPATIPVTITAIATLERNTTGGSLRAIVPNAANERALNDPCVAGWRPLHLSANVGTGGVNRPLDVRRVQARLVALGLLTAANQAAERPALPHSDADPQRVVDASLTQTIAAIATFRRARLGDPVGTPGLIEPVDATLARLNRPPRLELTDTVGWGPSLAAANRPPDVRRLQDRLLLLGFLAQADYDTERADPDAQVRIDQSLVQQTAVALALASEQRRRLELTGPVGSEAANAPADVRAVQDRLRGLGLLSETDYQREGVDPEAAGVVNTAALTSTFAAIATLRQRVFECPAAVVDEPWTAQPMVDVDDETHRFLNDPLFYGRYPLTLDGSVGTLGWNFPADVRAVQERLRTMRLLSDADFTTEAIDPLRTRRVGDLELVATREAIRRLRRSLLGEPAPVVERIEVRSAAVVALEDALSAVHVPLPLTDSVGWNGVNIPADVALVQRRLHALGFLSDADFELEAQVVPAPGEARIRDYEIAETIAAIDLFDVLMLDRTSEPLVEPLTELRSTLAWPVVPRAVDISPGRNVGRARNNAPADVRLIQNRLFELGLLAAADYFTERVDPAAAGRVADAVLPQTIAAIGRLQETLAGLARTPPDFVIDPGGRSARVLADPAWSTPTIPNANCAQASAGPARPVFTDANLMRVIAAIEAEEGGVSQGEIPAILRNASWTPTSWGAAQVIGGTAIGTVNAPANAAIANFYGLDAATLTRLQSIVGQTVATFDAITAAVANGSSEAALQVQIDTYVTNNIATVRANTGLGAADVGRMFRAAQLRRHLTALGVGGNEADLFNAATHPDAAANISALGLTQSHVGTYLRNPLFYGEHRQGFVTRALFLSPEGQIVRNLLTDDTGFKLGRFVVRDNWNSTPAALAARDRAQLTAYLHNHGGNAAALAGQMAMVAADGYVTRVIARYDNP